MKAVIEVAGSSVSGVQSGRVGRRRDVENEEIQMYLSKLKDLVPFMPKNKKLTKLEVIQYVIDYICDLQYALETHPNVNGVSSAEIAARLQGENGSSSTTLSGSGINQRQPLGLLTASPNTIVHCSSSPVSPIHSESSSLTMSPVSLDKVQEADSRPISC